MEGGGNILFSNITLASHKKLLLPRKINHPFYGFSYYFSNDIITTTNIEEIPRYVVFMDKCKYIVSTNNEIPLENFSSFYFQTETDIPMWNVKSSRFFTRI
jgi:hypothetical protein